jgi:hypothetical protein
MLHPNACWIASKVNDRAEVLTGHLHESTSYLRFSLAPSIATMTRSPPYTALGGIAPHRGDEVGYQAWLKVQSCVGPVGAHSGPQCILGTSEPRFSAPSYSGAVLQSA